ncbi:amidohydrolase [Falcatimonas sp. MSJ-15]|uniref:M20 family metallopeptidase n=1 Tax=Falcatimonas sp. MSJ-15 TaxID=2841515 RepID=UPI001C123206|nr:M20 family metallopeptidase [Falcatimonas sp. MSJ-15]MBU5471238.1 amidohydrolase [Falcatimonas sp. MSJ-15]
MNYYERALELKEEIIANRRYFHTNAEVGLDMPKAKAYVMKQLESYGIQAKECGHGVVATLGKGGKCILLRADMDALPMPEESGEEFACKTGDKAHACGHDFHAAMLLAAAKMLKETEDSLDGTVKLMFQPAEETFEGSKDMIEAGVLENPSVDAALAYHVSPGKMPVGLVMYNSKSTMMFSVDGFRINIKGKGSHGAYPHAGIDPINIGVHIHLALQELIAREADPNVACVLTIGKFQGGAAANIIPDTAVLEGTLRTNNAKERKKLVARIKEVAELTAAVYGGSAQIESLSSVPPLVCDETLTEEIIGYMREMSIPGFAEYPGVSASASEDFATIAERVPSTFMYLSAGYMDERGAYSAHNPKVRFNEDVCPIGASCLAYCAVQWLKNH